MTKFTYEILESMTYKDILRLAKEKNVSTGRKKKTLLIKKLLMLSENIEQEEFSQGFPDETTQGFGVGEVASRRSTFLIDEPKGNEPETEVNTRRSTFLIQLDGLDAGIKETSPDEQNGRRSTFLVKREGLDEEIKETSQDEQNGRRSTFLLKRGGLDEGIKETSQDEQNGRRSTFLLKRKGLDEEIKETSHDEQNGRRSTFLLKRGDISSSLSSAETNDCANPNWLSTDRKEENLKMTASMGGNDSPVLKRPKRSNTFIIDAHCNENRGVGNTSTLGLHNATLALETVVETEEFTTPENSPLLKSPATMGRITSRCGVQAATTPFSKKSTPLRKSIVKTPLQKSVSKPTLNSVVKTPLQKSVSKPTLNSVVKTPLQKSASKPTLNSGLKMPNFSAIHKRQFDRMESLIDNKERTAMRAIQLFSPPIKRANKGSELGQELTRRDTKLGGKQQLVRSKSFIPVAVSTKPVPMRTGVTPVLRGETRSSLASRLPTKPASIDKLREQGRFDIKGVRANKRFLLQMQMRNVT